MKFRPAKIWHTEDQILAAIDRVRTKAYRLVAEESELRQESAKLFGELEQTCFELMRSTLTKKEREQLETRERVKRIDASKARAEAERKANAYSCIMEKTIPRLGQVLSAFRTDTMQSVLGSYRGVVTK